MLAGDGVTEVFGNGQKITAVVLEYDREIQNRSVASDSFLSRDAPL